MLKGVPDMRVISGSAKGRPLKAVPGKNTRPTTDKVKEAIFSMIGPYFDGGLVLDLFAGTGGLGIEALSRGAERAVFVDIERASVEVVKANLTAARLVERAEVYRNDAGQAVRMLHKREMKFDYVFLDPPYRMKDVDKLLHDLLGKQLFNDGAIVVVEHDSDHALAERIGSLSLLKSTTYGETAVTIYKKEGNHHEDSCIPGEL